MGKSKFESEYKAKNEYRATEYCENEDTSFLGDLIFFAGLFAFFGVVIWGFVKFVN